MCDNRFNTIVSVEKGFHKVNLHVGLKRLFTLIAALFVLLSSSSHTSGINYPQSQHTPTHSTRMYLPLVQSHQFVRLAVIGD
jgi:tartrate-resistant acid phosphatase type 5